MPNVAVVGGGVMGMTLALRLTQQGHRVTLFERSPALGGLAAESPIGGYVWDSFYHVILASDTALTGLLEELGLAQDLQWRETRTGFYGDGRWHSLSSTLDYVRFPLIGPLSKARLGATILRASHERNPLSLESETALQWLTRWSGRRTVERLWGPLLVSKLGDNAPYASAAFIWAIIARLYAARRSGLKKERMGYVTGGYARILAALRGALLRAGVELRIGVAVESLIDHGTHTTVTTADGGTTFDHTVATCSTRIVSALCPQLRPAEHARLNAVRYQGVICASYMLRQPLEGFYVTNITDAGFPFTGVIEMTALVDRAHFGGHTLVYLPRYVTPDDPRWQRSDDDVADEMYSGLQRMLPRLSPDDVIARRVARARDVHAISTLHYSRDALPPLRTSLPRTFVVNSAQIAQATLNVNETVALATWSASALAGLFQSTVPEAVYG